MSKTAKQIAQEILDYIKRCGGLYGSWYVGITSDPQKRLFSEHGVREKGDSWIFRDASSVEEARAIEQYFVNSLGTDGGSGGGDASSRFVYAYKKSAHTRP